MKKEVSQIRIEAYDYSLPEDKIAKFPLANRADSKLLVYRAGEIENTHYNGIHHQLPKGASLYFNNTKVVQARLHFKKETGGLIEIFCLEPADAEVDVQVAMQQTYEVLWKCMIGGVKKWKENPIYLNDDVQYMEAHLVEKLEDAYLIRFKWNSDKTFSEILELNGELPLPPYMNRKADSSDKDRYQTSYALHEGSVAAPTAGLHFSKEVLASLESNGVALNYLTLHVGAGTFKPVKSEKMDGHTMHHELIDVPKSVIEGLAHNSQCVIPVGTTSLRTLESLYWLGVLVMENQITDKNLPEVPQWTPYEGFPSHSLTDSLLALLEFMGNKERLLARTQLIIAPGYRFKVASGLITNFHQPKSTLLLLVSALIGPDWEKIYEYALANNYRFLSYGDGCLLLP